MTIARGAVGPPGASASDTSASIAIELTRALLAAVARNSAATEASLAWLTGVERTSAATEATPLSAIQVTTSSPICKANQPDV